MVEIPTTFRAPSAYRPSTSIKRKPASNFWHAFNFAEDLGRPLTAFVTLNFKHTDCDPQAVSVQFMTLVERYFGPWWRRPSRRLRLGPQGAPVYVWVAENASGHPCIHWALHLPEERRADFIARLPKWLGSIVNTVHSPSAIDVAPVYNAAGLRLYLLKGCEPSYAAFCQIEHQPQGVVFGKRSCVSRSLQRTARERGNYTSRRSRRSRRPHHHDRRAGVTTSPSHAR